MCSFLVKQTPFHHGQGPRAWINSHMLTDLDKKFGKHTEQEDLAEIESGKFSVAFGGRRHNPGKLLKEQPFVCTTRGGYVGGLSLYAKSGP